MLHRALSHVCPVRQHLAPPQLLEGSGYERLGLINDMHGDGFIFRPADCVWVWSFALAAFISRLRARFSGKVTLWK